MSKIMMGIKDNQVAAIILLQFTLVIKNSCFNGNTIATNLSRVRGTRTGIADILKITSSYQCYDCKSKLLKFQVVRARQDLKHTIQILQVLLWIEMQPILFSKILTRQYFQRRYKRNTTSSVFQSPCCNQ